MRITIDIPDDVYQAAMAKAALEGRPLRALFLEGLELVARKPPAGQARLRKATFPIIASSPCGRVVTDEIVQKALETD